MLRDILIFLLSLTSTLPTLWGSFIFDDSEAIVNNEDVTGKSSIRVNGIPQLFWNDFWGSRLNHPNSHKSYRPFTILTYRFEYWLWGLNPLPFHILNWILHGINSILVFYFLKSCFKILNLKKTKIIFWSCLIFSVHPIHIEPLGGLVGRADLCSSTIFLIGFILTSSKLNPGIIKGILICGFGIFGSFFKENGIVIVILYILINIFSKRDKNNIKHGEIFEYAFIIIINVAFVSWRIWFQGGTPHFQPDDNPPAFANSYFTKVISILWIWIWNIWILINPIWSSFDWSMGCFDLIQSPDDYRFILVMFFLILLLRILYISSKSKYILLSLLISGSTFLPSSNLIFTVGFVIAERNLYLPSIGYSLIISYSFHHLLGKRRILKPILIFIIVLFYIRSIQRSFDWLNENQLFTSALHVCPNNAKVHYNIGTMYGEIGEKESAIKAYEKSIQLKSDYHQAMNNLGNILRAKDDLDGAEYWLRKAVQIKNDFPAAWMNLGIVLSKKNPKEALQCYKISLEYRPFYPDCEYNLGNLYLEMGYKDLALKAWNLTITMESTHTQSWLNLIILLEQEGRLIEAKTYAEKALSILDPMEHTLQFLLGNIHGRLENYDIAEYYFKKAIMISSTTSTPSKYWSNLGVLYHRWGKYENAQNCYEKSLELDSDNLSTLQNLEKLKRRLRRQE